ncbi:MAG: glycosyltransferase family 39 protein [Deltaproteobacteria bacterium]|nr:glycosyltransferase family 39 protein [Deltaproteobacteria bacterium]
MLKTWLRRFAEGPFYPVIIAGIYCLILGSAVYVTDYYPKGKIQDSLMTIIPWVLRINFLLLLLVVVASWKDIVGAFRSLDDPQVCQVRQDRHVAQELRDQQGCQDRQGRQGQQMPGLDGAGRPVEGWFKRHSHLLMLAGLLVVAAFLVSGVAPQVHRIYYDEDIYANVAQNIALTGKSGLCNYGTFEYGEYFNHWMVYNKEPSGWPFLISIVFQLFGVNEIYGFVLNNMLFVGGVLICFWIGYIISGRFFPAFIGAAVYAAIPHNLLWSNTVAAEPAAAVFGGLAVLCLLVYLKSGRLRHLLLLCLVIPLASQMRAESALIGIWGFAAVLVWSPKTLLRRGVWGAGLLTLILVLPHLLHVYAVSGESWGAQGAKFSLAFFKSNIAVNAAYYFDNKLFPVVFTLLALIGVLIPFSKSVDSGQGKKGEALNGVCLHQGDSGSLFGNSKVLKVGFCNIPVGRFFTSWLILLWFILFYGIFLFFYAGSYKYGADVRFALVSFMPLAVLSGMGADRLRGGMGWLAGRMQSEEMNVGCGVLTGVMVTIIFFSWVSFLPLIRLVGQEAWGARYDHQYAREFIKKIPNRSIVLTHIPTMMLLWQQGAIQTFAGTNNPDLIDDLLKKYEGNVYFHESYWCSTSTDHKDLCRIMGERYDLEEVVSALEQGNHYGLYRIKKR